MNKKIILTIFIFINFVFAQTFPIVTKSCEFGACTWADFIEAIRRAIQAILVLGFWIACIFGLVGAIMIMVGGVARTIELGKKLLFTATIGYAVLLSAGIIFDLFLEFIQPKLHIPQ
jgi:hypothetical protein